MLEALVEGRKLRDWVGSQEPQPHPNNLPNSRFRRARNAPVRQCSICARQSLRKLKVSGQVTEKQRVDVTCHLKHSVNIGHSRYIIPTNPGAPNARTWSCNTTQRLLRFGVFELNLDTEELRKDGLLLRLGPQPFKVLAMLTSRSGQIVTREEIRQEVWGDETYVDFEHGLNQCIKQIFAPR